MPTALHIFLEMKPVNISIGTAGHLYLVLREVEVDAQGQIQSNVPTANDRVLRGDLGIPSTALITQEMLLSESALR